MIPVHPSSITGTSPSFNGGGDCGPLGAKSSARLFMGDVKSILDDVYLLVIRSVGEFPEVPSISLIFVNILRYWFNNRLGCGFYSSLFLTGCTGSNRSSSTGSNRSSSTGSNRSTQSRRGYCRTHTRAYY